MTFVTPTDNDNTNTSHSRKHFLWFILSGIGLVAIGMLELYFAFFSTLFSIAYLAGFFIILSLGEFLQSLQLKKLPSFILHAFLSVFYFIAAIILILDPLNSAITLTLWVAILFFIIGCIKITVALTRTVFHRRSLLFDGLISLLLGVIIWKEWPFNSPWVLGTLIGINTLCTGLTWIMTALFLKNNSSQPYSERY